MPPCETTVCGNPRDDLAVIQSSDRVVRSHSRTFRTRSSYGRLAGRAPGRTEEECTLLTACRSMSVQRSRGKSRGTQGANTTEPRCTSLCYLKVAPVQAGALASDGSPGPAGRGTGLRDSLGARVRAPSAPSLARSRQVQWESGREPPPPARGKSAPRPLEPVRSVIGGVHGGLEPGLTATRSTENSSIEVYV